MNRHLGPRRLHDDAEHRAATTKPARSAGHVSDAVRPAPRRRGRAGEILRRSVVFAQAPGVGRVLVRGNDTNDAAAAATGSWGCVLERVVRPSEADDGVAFRRAWIA